MRAVQQMFEKRQVPFSSIACAPHTIVRERQSPQCQLCNNLLFCSLTPSSCLPPAVPGCLKISLAVYRARPDARQGGRRGVREQRIFFVQVICSARRERNGKLWREAEGTAPAGCRSPASIGRGCEGSLLTLLKIPCLCSSKDSFLGYLEESWFTLWRARELAL